MTEHERTVVRSAVHAIEDMANCVDKRWALQMLDDILFPGTPAAYQPVPRHLGNARTFRAVNGGGGVGNTRGGNLPSGTAVAVHKGIHKPVYRPSAKAVLIMLSPWLVVAVVWWLL